MTAPHELGRAYETSLPAEVRRRDGIHYTPPAVVVDLVALALVALGRLPRLILDPACGAGAFLLGALDALVAAGVDPADALGRVRGLDLDAGAVNVARRAIAEWAVGHGIEGPDDPGSVVAVADALAVDWPGGVDLVVGNPPFGGQLRGPTVRGRERSMRTAAVLGGISGHADTAALFLVRAVEAIDPGGVVVLVQPTSVLAARGTAAVRQYVDERATVRSVRFPDPSGFDAAVQVCAPVIVRDRVGGKGSGTGAVTWSELAAHALGLPKSPAVGRRTLGDLADVTAGFRDEFYAVAACVVEDGDADVGDDAPDGDRPRLVTSGSIEPGRVLWGARPTTVLRRRFERPVVDIDALRARTAGSGAAARTDALIERRRAPKVLVATQTRGLEAVADPDGRLWPSVPVVSVLPRSIDVWWVLAVLVSREATAWMTRRAVGTGLSPGAVRVSAPVLAGLPVPDDVDRWGEAAASLRRGAQVDDPSVLDAMSGAYASFIAPGGPRISRRSDGSG